MGLIAIFKWCPNGFWAPIPMHFALYMMEATYDQSFPLQIAFGKKFHEAKKLKKTQSAKSIEQMIYDT